LHQIPDVGKGFRSAVGKGAPTLTWYCSISTLGGYGYETGSTSRLALKLVPHFHP